MLAPDEGIPPFVAGEMSKPQEKLNELSMEKLIYFFEKEMHPKHFEEKIGNELVE